MQCPITYNLRVSQCVLQTKEVSKASWNITKEELSKIRQESKAEQIAQTKNVAKIRMRLI